MAFEVAFQEHGTGPRTGEFRLMNVKNLASARHGALFRLYIVYITLLALEVLSQFQEVHSHCS